MKSAIILAAGCSRRLKDLTKYTPKSLLSVGQRKIIDNHLTCLSERGYTDIVIVTGYLNHQIENYIGREYKQIKITYKHNSEYESTGHSYSLYQGFKSVDRNSQSILVVHADGLFPQSFYKVIDDRCSDDVILYDSHYKLQTNDEILVIDVKNGKYLLERSNKITDSRIYGEYIGLHKFSFNALAGLVSFMDRFPDNSWKQENYEAIFNLFVKDDQYKPQVVDVAGEPWININHPEDLQYARNIVWPFICTKSSNKASLYLTPSNSWTASTKLNSQRTHLYIDSLYGCLTSSYEEVEQSILISLRDKILNQLFAGYGFCVVSSKDKYSKEEDMLSIYKKISRSLGQTIDQDNNNTHFYRVYSEGRSMKDGTRYSRSSDSGSFHTDNPSEVDVPDIIGLLCIRNSVYGGESCIINILPLLYDLYNNEPHIAKYLESDYIFERRNLIDSALQLSKFPLVVWDDDYSFRYLRDYINLKELQKRDCNDLDLKERALSCLDYYLSSNKYLYEVKLDAGDMLFINNKKLAHGRRAFKDSSSEHSQRMMMRVWIKRN